MTDEVTQAIEDLEKLAAEYAKAEGERVQLAEFRKSKKAILMKAAEKDHKTTAAQEREAYASDEYVNLLEGLGAATEKAVFYRYRIKAIEMRFEAWRTKNANHRARMSSGVGR